MQEADSLVECKRDLALSATRRRVWAERDVKLIGIKFREMIMVHFQARRRSEEVHPRRTAWHRSPSLRPTNPQA
jgi:hypothetical protein